MAYVQVDGKLLARAVIGKALRYDAGPEQMQTLADRLLAHGDEACAARAWTLLGQAAWLRADRQAALACLDHTVRLFEPQPDSAQKADAYAELGRLHILNYERDPAVAAADTAAEIGERLGLTAVYVPIDAPRRR